MELSQAKVVVTSSWFMFSPKRIERISEFLAKLKITNIDWIRVDLKATYNGKDFSYRTLGIIDYLYQHPNSCYLILDDEFEEEYDLLNLHHLITNPNTGLVKENLANITFQQPDLMSFSKIKYQQKNNRVLRK